MKEQHSSIGHEPSVEATPPKGSSKLVPLLVVCIVVLLCLVSGLVGYLIATKSFPMPLFTPPSMPTNSAGSPTPTPPPPSAESTVTSTPLTAISPTPFPTAPPGSTRIISNLLGITFLIGTKLDWSPGTTIQTKEAGTKLFVYLSNAPATQGQFIERFEKSPMDSLPQALEKRFLSSIPETDCFVRVDTTKSTKTIARATIASTGGDNPNLIENNKCPEGYRESNGLAYFFEDTNFPDRFYYVSIGQYGIPSSDSMGKMSWQDTITVF